MTADIYRFATKYGKCSKCGKAMIKANPHNNPAYHDYWCAVSAQPEYCKASLRTEGDGRKGVA